jgi:hypothetical protein
MSIQLSATRCGYVALTCVALLLQISNSKAEDVPIQDNVSAESTAPTSNDWRDDAANLEAIKLLNKAYSHQKFSEKFEDVLDECPITIDWEVGPNTPVAWKGGTAGLIDGEILLTGGLWMPGRHNLAFAMNLKDKTYKEIPAPSVSPQYTQGVCDGESLFIVGGRGAGRSVLRLAKSESGDWEYHEMPLLPESEGPGRWLAASAIVPGKWLFLVQGIRSGTFLEYSKENPSPLPNYRLQLDKPNAEWEEMAPFPGRRRSLQFATAVGNDVYFFGGRYLEPQMRECYEELYKRFKLDAPECGVPCLRDVYKYNTESNSWVQLRNLPFPALSGAAIPLNDRFILLMAVSEPMSYRVGKSAWSKDPKWTGFGDHILCYDIEKDKYSQVGVSLYGVGTAPWVRNGDKIYSFGGEPKHNFNDNTENVMQIGTIKWKESIE